MSRSPARPGFAPPAVRSPRQAATVESQLLERVLRRPDLAATVDPGLVRADSADGAALQALIAFARESGEGLTLGQVSARFEGTDHAPAIEAALRRGHVLDELDGTDLDLAAELAGLQERVALQRVTARKAELEARGLSALSPEEHREWSELQARQATAKGAGPALETPPKR